MQAYYLFIYFFIYLFIYLFYTTNIFNPKKKKT